MKFKRLTLQNFRGIRNLDLGFHDRLTVLIGSNGSGKTSILDAIAIGLSHWQARYFTFDGSQHPSKESHYAVCEVTETKFRILGNDFNEDHFLPGQALIPSDVFNGEDEVSCSFSVADDAQSIAWDGIGNLFGTQLPPEPTQTISWEMNFSKKTRIGRHPTGEITSHLQWRPTSIPYLVYLPLDRIYRHFSDTTAIPNSTLREILDGKVPAVGTLEFIHGKISAVKPVNPVSIVSNVSFRDLLKELTVLQEREQETLHEMVDNGEMPKDASAYQSQPLRSVKEAWKKLLPEGFTRFTVKKDDTGNFYLLLRKDGIDITDAQLSDGERGLLSLVGAIAMQLSYRTDDNAFNKPGIILIDEIELHLHPKWQREVIPKLLEIFPLCQFIVTTHSPQVLGGVRDGSVVFLTNSENGIVAKECNENLYGMSSNDILETVLGGFERDKDINRLMREFYEALENDKIPEAQTVFDALMRETNIPEIETMAMRLRRKEFLKK
jgi:predicted ATPase